MLKIRQSCDHLIFNKGIPIPWKNGLYTETGPCVAHHSLWPPLRVHSSVWCWWWRPGRPWRWPGGAARHARCANPATPPPADWSARSPRRYAGPCRNNDTSTYTSRWFSARLRDLQCVEHRNKVQCPCNTVNFLENDTIDTS